jgi:cyclophilin family peptidyl-prolyl cis-trans isomerase
MRRLLAAIAIVLAVGVSGALAAARAPRPRRKPPAAKPPALHAPTEKEIAAARKAGKVMVALKTDKGTITLELDGAAAPTAVANYLNLIKTGFYDGMPFHRVEPGFVIQAGDPSLVGRPPAGYTVPDERSPIKHTRGVIAMARSYRGNEMVPNSASTEFYICLGDAPHLDRLGFTAFGEITNGIDVIDRIQRGDKIRKASILPAAGPRR